MAPAAGNAFAVYMAEYPNFLNYVRAAIIEKANEKLTIEAVPEGNAGYQAYLKITNLANNVINNPDLYKKEFARKVALVWYSENNTFYDMTNDNYGQLLDWVRQVRNDCAGVTANDQNF